MAGEADELRKAKIRRFMTSTKVADYDVAALYLEGADYVLEAAIEVYFADEAWEKRNAAAAAAPQKKDKKRGFWRGL